MTRMNPKMLFAIWAAVIAVVAFVAAPTAALANDDHDHRWSRDDHWHDADARRAHDAEVRRLHDIEAARERHDHDDHHHDHDHHWHP